MHRKMRTNTNPQGGCAKSLLILVVLATILSLSDGYVRVCYFTNWSQHRTGKGKFLPEDIDPYVCTHILFSFASANASSNSITTIEPNDLDLYNRTTALKKQNPSLKIILALGGWNAKSTDFTKIAATDATMNEFNVKALAFLREHNFDGLDIDWEYPTDRDGNPEDKQRFTLWLQSLRRLFEQDAAETRRPRLELMIAVVGSIGRARRYYEISNLAKAVDYINIMSYDFHGNWDAAAGAHSHADLFSSVDGSLSGWVADAGLPAKITMGIPLYGNSVMLKSSTNPPPNNGVGEPSTGPGMKGPHGPQDGILTYLEICEYIKNNGWTSKHIPSLGTTVAWGSTSAGLEWTGYDDIESIKQKIEYIQDKGLAGAMVWSLDYEDYGNFCGKGKYPLLNALKDGLANDNDRTAPPTTSTTATTTTTTTSTTSRPTTTTTTMTTTTTTTPKRTTTTKAPKRKLRNWGACRIQYMPRRWCNPARSLKRNPRKFALTSVPALSLCLVCMCNHGYVYNPCTKTCDRPSVRKTCSLAG